MTVPSASVLVPVTVVALFAIGPVIVGHADLAWQLASLTLSIVHPLCFAIISLI